jgi:hypothetical protein
MGSMVGGITFHAAEYMRIPFCWFTRRHQRYTVIVSRQKIAFYEHFVKFYYIEHRIMSSKFG